MTASVGPAQTRTVRYELHDNQAADLAGQLLTLHPPTTRHRFVCYRLDGRSPFADLGRRIELEVFDEAFGNDLAVMQREYGPYEDASFFLVVMDQVLRRPAGVMRVIRNSATGLKTLRDIAGEPLGIGLERFRDFHAVDSLDATWDVGTVAVLPEYRRSATRSRTVCLLLYRAVYVHAMRDGVRHFVTVVDEHAHRGLRALGVAYVPICDTGPFSYLDSASSTAVYGFVPEFQARMEARYRRLRRQRPLRWCLLARPIRQLMRGIGLDVRLQPPVD
ncbi:MAG TPA: hypothetical protein VK402_12320 [Blastococcus sp.]|nr:hypothetical protein [Blastococcus sp.]